MHCKSSRNSSNIWKHTSTLTFVGCLSIMLFLTTGYATQVSDTCGHYFFLPMFPACDMFLEAIPCFNDTPNVIVTMATPAGDVIYSFHLIFGAMTELELSSINRAKYEGLIIRSNEDISLYIHNTSGDSMIVFPIDSLGRDYEIQRLSTNHRNTGRDKAKNSKRNTHDGVLYIFSPFNNTSITIVQLFDATDSISNPSSPLKSSLSSVSSSSFSSTTVKLDAFEIYEYQINTYRRYRLHSADVFAVILVQTSRDYFDNGSICVDVAINLLDFVPPYTVKGKYFYLAFPRVTDFIVFIVGFPNSSLELTSDSSSKEIVIDQTGNTFTEITKTSSVWVTASHPVSVYIKLTLCSNASSPSSRLCADNGFYLPSVEYYFNCEGNMTEQGCECLCPSVFQREINPLNFYSFRNESSTRPTTIYPLLVGELFDVTTVIISSLEFKDAHDIIITTNTSFLAFRYDMDNLNFLPAGSTLGNVYKLCPMEIQNIVFKSCDELDQSADVKNKLESHNSNYEFNQCMCEFVQDSSLVSVAGYDKGSMYDIHGRGGKRPRSDKGEGGDEFVWIEDDEDTARPLIAVVVSLCVSIFAVIALISGYMLVEMTTRRKHVRNTKIRPFMS